MPRLEYFPPLLASEKGSSFSGYRETLQEMEELPLFPIPEQGKYDLELRFLHLPSFDLGRLIRIRAIGTTWCMIHKRREYTRHIIFYSVMRQDKVVETFRHHEVLHRTERLLSDSEANRLKALIEQLELPSLPAEDEINLIGCDGESWLLEGVIDRQYYAIHRRSPVLPQLVELGEYLLTLNR